MSLQEDMIHERDGIQVRNIPGLGGVDYLSPDNILLNYVSYVFGPMIRALVAQGYAEGKDLDAAPYDWRVAPSTLETRDAYFTKTMHQIEAMYQTNGQRPVVLVCHSMGCKIGHCLLNFAKHAKGQTWVDQYIHTYCPIGGPHLGAPKALRSFVSGDKMGLDTFLNDEEGLILGRSLGSGPLLLPAELPATASSPSAFVRRDGAIEISIVNAVDTSIFLSGREQGHIPKKLKFTMIYNKRSRLTTPFTMIDDSDQTVTIDDSFIFRTDVSGPQDRDRSAVLLYEPGLSRARKHKSRLRSAHLRARENFFRLSWKIPCYDNEDIGWGWPSRDRPFWCALNLLTFFWLWWPITRFVTEWAFKIYFFFVYCTCWGMIQGPAVTMDEISKTSGSTLVLASGYINDLRSAILPVIEQQQQQRDENETTRHLDVEVDLISSRDRRRIFSCCLDNRSTTATLRIKWIPFNAICQRTKRSNHAICETKTKDCPIEAKGVSIQSYSKGKPNGYTAVSGYNLLAAEGLNHIFDTMDQVYENDLVDPRGLSSIRSPPVRSIKAIYGVNLPTEVGTVYKRQQAVLKIKTRPTSVFVPDKKAILHLENKMLSVKDGIISERATVQQQSGDGTVPYWSLNHVRTWDSASCKVTVDELPRAEHGEILADKRLHGLLIDYCCESKG